MKKQIEQLSQLSMDFKSLCKPIEKLGLEHISYHKNQDNGKRFSLSNKPNWIQDYYGLNLYKSSMFEKKPSLYTREFNVWLDEYDLSVYQHGRDYFNSRYSISILEPDTDGAEVFIFGVSQKGLSDLFYVSQHRELLYRFILHLKNKGKNLLSRANNQSIQLPKVHSEQLLMHSKKNILAQFDRYTSIQAASCIINRNKIHFTPQETMCIKHLIQNKTAPEIGEIVRLSTRTIESYIYNIKNKVGVNTKRELIEILTNTPLIGL